VGAGHRRLLLYKSRLNSSKINPAGEPKAKGGHACLAPEKQRFYKKLSGRKAGGLPRPVAPPPVHFVLFNRFLCRNKHRWPAGGRGKRPVDTVPLVGPGTYGLYQLVKTGIGDIAGADGCVLAAFQGVEQPFFFMGYKFRHFILPEFLAAHDDDKFLGLDYSVLLRI
jgi:hypothetical protein